MTGIISAINQGAAQAAMMQMALRGKSDNARIAQLEAEVAQLKIEVEKNRGSSEGWKFIVDCICNVDPKVKTELDNPSIYGETWVMGENQGKVKSCRRILWERGFDRYVKNDSKIIFDPLTIRTN